MSRRRWTEHDREVASGVKELVSNLSHVEENAASHTETLGDFR